MGLGLGFSCGSRDDYPKREVVYVEQKVDINPNPYNFKIKKTKFVNGHTIALVNYPNCTTYNGDKLMLLRGIHKHLDKLDPHFLDDNHIVIARFIPKQFGWKMAEICAENYYACID